MMTHKKAVIVCDGGGRDRITESGTREQATHAEPSTAILNKKEGSSGGNMVRLEKKRTWKKRTKEGYVP